MAGTKRGGTAAFSSRPLFFRPFSPWLAACTKALTFHITGRFILELSNQKGETGDMQKDELYSIGEVSRICNISKKALRFYDQLGVVRPDMVCRENGYRYYSR